MELVITMGVFVIAMTCLLMKGRLRKNKEWCCGTVDVTEWNSNGKEDFHGTILLAIYACFHRLCVDWHRGKKIKLSCSFLLSHHALIPLLSRDTAFCMVGPDFSLLLSWRCFFSQNKHQMAVHIAHHAKSFTHWMDWVCCRQSIKAQPF